MIYPTTTILPADRDLDGLYPIGPGNMHIFPFQVPFLGSQLITLKHAMPLSQDWSMRASITQGDNDIPVAINSQGLNEINLDRSNMTLEFWSAGIGPAGSIQVDPNQSYYLNILNMQNQVNGYFVTFSL